MAEGDFWFDYPWKDVLSCLEGEHGYDVKSVVHKAAIPPEAIIRQSFSSTFSRLPARQ